MRAGKAGTNSAGATVRRYLRLLGSVDETFLMIDYSMGGTPMETWAHTNRLGSTVATSDAVGVVLDTYTYDDYGNSGAEGTSGFPFRFTGQKLDPETGLMYYKARYYSGELGRFLQVDPIGYEDQMNLYAYVANDPTNLTDPSGKCPWCAVGFVIGVAAQTYSEVKSGSFGEGKTGMQKAQAVGRILLSGGAGALGGGAGTQVAKAIVGNTVKAAAARTAANTAAGGAIGAGQATGNAALEGRAPTAGEVGKGAATGALFSAGGSAAGEAIDAGGRAIASARNAGAADAAMVERMVQTNGLPGGAETPSGLPSGPTSHPASTAGAAVGNATANAIANAAPVVEDIRK